jgi:hypothetical protein
MERRIRFLKTLPGNTQWVKLNCLASLAMDIQQ